MKVSWASKGFNLTLITNWPKGMDNVCRAGICRIPPSEESGFIVFWISWWQLQCWENIFPHGLKNEGSLTLSSPIQPPVFSWLPEPWQMKKLPSSWRQIQFQIFVYVHITQKYSFVHSKESPSSRTESSQQDRNFATASCNLRTAVCISPLNRLTLLGLSFSLSIPL